MRDYSPVLHLSQKECMNTNKSIDRYMKIIIDRKATPNREGIVDRLEISSIKTRTYTIVFIELRAINQNALFALLIAVEPALTIYTGTNRKTAKSNIANEEETISGIESP
jgi:hypothetical protein